MSWPVVTFTQSSYIVCEDVGILTVTLKREGNLKGSSVVKIQVKDRSAKSGTDYTPSEVGEVQFEPGNFIFETY